MSPKDASTMINMVDDMLSRIRELAAVSEQSDDPYDGWAYNRAVEELGHAMVNAAPSLLILARLGLDQSTENQP